MRSQFGVRRLPPHSFRQLGSKRCLPLRPQHHNCSCSGRWNSENYQSESDSDRASSTKGSRITGSSPEDAAADLRASLRPDKECFEGETARTLQIVWIRSWADRGQRLIPESWFEQFQLVSNDTSEHEVRFDLKNSRAVKRTIAGHFGQVPTVERGVLNRKLATPLEYLERLSLQNTVFADDFLVEGVIISDKPSMILFEGPGQPSFVVSQQWVIAAEPSNPTPSAEEIIDYLRSRGFEPAPRSYFGWFRREDGVLIVDAKPDNFMKTSEGVTPIDLQMSRTSPDELPIATVEFGDGSLIILP